MTKHDYTDYIVSRIADICIRYKRREGGSASSRASGDDMAAEAAKYADVVEKQDFRINPHCFVLSIPLFAVFAILASVASLLAFLRDLPFLFLVGDILIFVGFAIFIPEYIFYRQTLDTFAPQKTGMNVFAVRKAKGESKRRIIICGHRDAAYEMPVLMHFNTTLLYVIIGITLIGSVQSFILNNIMFLDFLPQRVHMVFIIFELFCALACVPIVFFVDFRTIVDGANDNLTGCFIGMSLLKEMADNDFRFENTDVCCLFTDGEEAGLRGAAAFARDNIDMLMEKNTMVLIADTIHEKEELRIYSRGINYTESNAEEACDLLYFSAMKYGLELPYAEFYPGANDSEAFSREGVKSAAICGVRHVPAPYYHTRQDTYTNLNPECIELVRDIVRSAVFMFDKAGKIF